MIVNKDFHLFDTVDLAFISQEGLVSGLRCVCAEECGSHCTAVEPCKATWLLNAFSCFPSGGGVPGHSRTEMLTGVLAQLFSACTVGF